MYVYQPGAIQIQQNNRILQQNLGRTNTQRTNGVSIRNIRLKWLECKPQNLEDVHRYLFQVTELQQNNTECCDSPSTKNSSQQKWVFDQKTEPRFTLGSEVSSCRGSAKNYGTHWITMANISVKRSTCWIPKMSQMVMVIISL